MALHDAVELAHEPDFALGRLKVSPSRRELTRDDGERIVIEHRVMQVLIALNRAEGAIVTRDELIASCWNGRVVGEDSINRALSRLRKVTHGIGAGSVKIETITKVGYRLTRAAATPESGDDARQSTPWFTVAPARLPRLSRRDAVLGSAAMVAAAGAGAMLWKRLAEPAVAPEIAAMVMKARQLRDQNTREAQYQAIGLMRRVVAQAPDYADGWGILGCAYAVPSHYRAPAEAAVLRARSEAAGRRALQLDPGNGYGELALSIALANRADDDEMLTFKAVALIFVGRSTEALSYYDRIKERPLTPAVYNNYIRALWSAGRLEETDRAMADAAALYPTQSTIWVTRFHINMFSGRPRVAIAMAGDEDARPTDVGGPPLADWIAQAQAIETRDPKLLQSARASQMKRARVAAFGAEYAVRVLSALGQIDDAFAVAHAYYFGRGFRIPDNPERPDDFTLDQRQTRFLFEPVTKPMRADSRFERLVGELGLDRYWRQSGTLPDYRRPG